ncbi:hypothetical protein [uncultured Pontibacter sp.]|uniref:HD domain-containing protein n=1 Tax=uncultured Pontibacter sp. TaxID=453356 RepID=UPI00262C6B30|nr:hypothetical protein [uncultured Pontibacter sp.]
MISDLQLQWEKLCAEYTTDTALVAQLWNELAQAHTSETRHYHTLDHLAYMLELADKYRQPDISYEALQFAIYYHDIIYNPTTPDNEEKSAALAEIRLKALGLPEQEIAFVKELILATKTHHSGSDDATTNFMLDLDLAILGAGWQKYNVYRQAVRKEYSMYSDADFQSGRSNMLVQFISQPNIFKTPFFQERLELQARENLRMELDMLGYSATV